MLVLGIADGLRPSAAVVLDDRLVSVQSQEEHDRTRGTRGVPWAAIRDALEEVGLRERDVDVIAVAGRFSPPLFLRRRPSLRRLTGEDAFSPALDLHVFAQAMLRQSGFGAYEEDRIAEWFERRFEGRGWAPQRVTMVDLHKALAEAVYRCQPHDDLFVLTAHPKGDGVSFGTHRGQAGQVQRVWAQRGYASLHVHLQRAAAALGYTPFLDDSLMWGAAARGTPDPDLVRLLAAHLHRQGSGFSRLPYPAPSRSAMRLWRGLARADRPTAAASILDNLITAVTDVVRHHLHRTGLRRVGVGGAIFDNPRLLAAIAALDEVEELAPVPPLGFAMLSVGAAVSAAGTAPTLLPAEGLGRRFDDRKLATALSAAGFRATSMAQADRVARAVDTLGAGDAVAIFAGRGGYGRTGLGARTVLVRGDDPNAVERVRKSLLRPDDEEPSCIWDGDPADGAARHIDKLGGGERYGGVAVEVDGAFARRYIGAVTWDGRAHLQRATAEDRPMLHAILTELRRRHGCGAVAGFPLAERDDPLPAVPSDAIQVFRRCGLALLLMGPFLVTR